MVSLGSLFRYQFIIFALPLILICARDYPASKKAKYYQKSFGAIGLCWLLCFTGLAAWSARNLSMGLAPLRENYFLVNTERNQRVEDWIKTWTISQ